MGHKAKNTSFLNLYKLRRLCSTLKISFCDSHFLGSVLSSFDYEWDDKNILMKILIKY